MKLIVGIVVIGIVALFWMIAADIEPVRTYAVNEAPGVVSTIDAMTTTEQPTLTGPTEYKPLISIGKPDIDPSEVVNITFALINEERAERGMRELKQEVILMTVAHSHSADMAARDYFAHETPEGHGPTVRTDIKGFRCRQYAGGGSFRTAGVSENIYASTLNKRYTNEELAKGAVESWMGSRGHRRNILDSTTMKTGIGVALSENGNKVLFTQVFC